MKAKKILAASLALSMLASTPVMASTTNPEVQGKLDTAIKAGDVNNDGKNNAEDALEVLKIIVGKMKQQPAHLRTGDVNADGALSSRDALLLLQDAANIKDLGFGYEEKLEEVQYYIPEGFEEAEPGIGFLGADGYGKYATGGQGGDVIEVTNLDDSGPGSFRAAVEAKGKRIVVFKVSGTIYLKKAISVKNGDITIAGQTAPGDGICLANYGFSVSNTENVIVRYLRVRPGDMYAAGGDAVNVQNSKNVILDHISASWGCDETLSVSPAGSGDTYDYVSDNVSIQWCMISESITQSANNEGKRHGMGSLIRGAQGSKVTYHHNMYSAHSSRMPMIGNYIESEKDHGNFSVEFINNLVYNWSGQSSGKCSDADENGEKVYITRYNYVNNYFKPGPLSTSETMFAEGSIANQMYADGNMMNGKLPESQRDLVEFNAEVLASDVNPYYKKYGRVIDQEAYFLKERFSTTTMTQIQQAEDAAEDVLAYAGASLSRDTVDEAIVDGYNNGTGKLINYIHESAGWTGPSPSSNTNPVYAQEVAGGHPDLAQYPPYEDTDKDGMSDAWEDFMKLDKDNATDGKAQYGDTTFTNLDVFLQFLVENPSAAIGK